MIGILDYGVGNIGAFIRIYHNHNIEAMPIKECDDFKHVKKIILPGVGSFDSAMKKLNNSGLRETLDEYVLIKKYPLLGVCIGMHMLGQSSEEGSSPGLSYISGVTKKISPLNGFKANLIPHMGWNSIKVEKEDAIWSEINTDLGFYFLHSYYFQPKSTASVIGVSDYYSSFACAIRSNEIYGFQFHPEKSLSNGTQLLLNFALSI